MGTQIACPGLQTASISETEGSEPTYATAQQREEFQTDSLSETEDTEPTNATAQQREEIQTDSLSETEGIGNTIDIAQKTKRQDDMLFPANKSEVESALQTDENSLKEEEAFDMQDFGATCQNEQEGLSRLQRFRTSGVDNFDNVVMVTGSASRSVPGLSLEFDDLKKKYQSMSNERNSLQQKLFEMQSEFCSVEIERDLEKESSRYFEEHISSLNSSVSLKENELVSLRKRYKLLNEGFLNSETLREGLERDLAKMAEVLRELEDRVEKSDRLSLDKKENGEVKSGKVMRECHYAECHCAEAKLEPEALTLNAKLENERLAKKNLEDMFANLEGERSLLLKEVEELRNEHQRQIDEIHLLRDRLRERNKQDHRANEQRLAQQFEQKHQHKECFKRESKLSLKTSILEDENKKLEDELYQQLSLLEKLEVENKSFAGPRKELEEISDQLKVLGFCTVDQLTLDYTTLKEGKLELQARIKHLKEELLNCQNSDASPTGTSSAGITKACPHFIRNSAKLSCVPRSEYLKLTFQLKSLKREIDSLRQDSCPQIVREKVTSSVCKHDRHSKKRENRFAKKWLKTIKDSVNVVTQEYDITTEQCSLLENKLHEANIHIDELLHELEISKEEKEVLFSTNRKREDEIIGLKLRSVEHQRNHNVLLGDVKAKLAKVERNLEDEIKKNVEKVEALVCLEEQNQIELEKLKEKFESLQREKDKLENELDSLRFEMLKNFGNQSIQSVCKSLSSAKERSFEYAKIIDNSKNKLVELEQDYNSLQQVNTILREELIETRGRLEKMNEVIATKYQNDLISEKLERDRLQVLLQTLEGSKKNENDILTLYMNQKQELEKSQTKVKSLQAELQESKYVLSEKENECETSNVIMRELEATCEVYEMELRKPTGSHENDDMNVESKESDLSSDESQEDDLSENGSNSTAENFKEMQEMLQERMAMKVERLQNRLKEALAAVSSSQELNISLQKRLHAAEKKHVEEMDGRTPEQEFLETVLNKLDKKEKEMQELLQRKTCDAGCAHQQDKIENDSTEMLSRYREGIKQLKIDNARGGVRLVEAHDRITKLEEKLAMCQYDLDQNSNGPDVKYILYCEEPNENSNLPEEKDENGSEARGNASSMRVSNTKTNKGGNTCETNADFKEELDCMTAKYVNLKAAFEGCLRRLRILEAGCYGNNDGKHEFYQISNPETEFTTASRNSKNQEINRETQTVEGPLFSEISSSFQESDSESDSVRADRMVIELTLTENDMERLETLAKREEFLQESPDLKDEYFKNRISALEIIIANKTDEIHRVKECSFKERMDFENKLRALQEQNISLKANLAVVEEERASLADRSNKVEAKLQQIKISAMKGEQILKSTIQELKDSEYTMKERMKGVEIINDQSKRKMDELQGRLSDCSQEIQRVKVESYKEGKSYKKSVNEFEREIEVYRKEKAISALKISELEQKVRMWGEETVTSKVSLRDETYEECIERLQNEIVDLRNENCDLNCEKEQVLVKSRKLENNNNALKDDQKLYIASLQEEKETLESTNINLRATITKQQETLVLEKASKYDLKCKFRADHKECENRVIVEIEKCENTEKRLQQEITILENRIEDLKLSENSLLSKITELEYKIDSFNEEKKQGVVTLCNEKQRWQNTVTELKEKFIVENMEKDNVISQHRKEKEEYRTLLLDEKTQFEYSAKEFQDKFVILENEIESYKCEKNNLEKQMKEKKSLEKACCLDDKIHLEDTIKQLRCTIATMEEKHEQENMEKDIAVSQVQKESEEINAVMIEERRVFNYIGEKLQESVVVVGELISKHGNQNDDTKIVHENTNSSLQDEDTIVKDMTTLDGTNCHLYSRILVLGETIESKMLENKTLLANANEVNENTETCLHNSRKQFEMQIKVLQDSIAEKEMKIQSFIDELTEREEESDGTRNLFLKEKHSLEDTIECLQNSIIVMESELREKQMFGEEMESSLQKTMSKNEILELQIGFCIDELQRIKSIAFREMQTKEADIRNFEETIVYMKKSLSDGNQELKHFNSVINDSETICLYLKDELERVKKYSFKESEGLFDEITKLTEAMSSTQKTCDDLKVETSHLVCEEKESTEIILSLQQELQRIKICAFEERQHLQNKKTSFQRNVLDVDQQILTLRTHFSELDKEKMALETEVLQRHEEIFAGKKAVEKHFQNEIVELNKQVSLLKLHLSKCEEQNVSLEADLLSNFEKHVANLENENKSFEDNIVNCNSEISLLKTRIYNVEEEKEHLVHGIFEKNREVSGFRITVEKLEEEMNALGEKNVTQLNEISLLEATNVQLDKEKQCLVTDIHKQNVELSAYKITVKKLEEEMNALGEKNVKQLNEISLLEATNVQLNKEKQCLVNDIDKQNDELSACKITVEKRQEKAKSLEEEIEKRGRDLASQTSSVFTLKEGEQPLTNEIVEKVEELSSYKIIVGKLQEQKKILEDLIEKRDGEISLLESKILKLQKEKDFLANDIMTNDEKLFSFDMTVEKLRVENKSLEEDKTNSANEISVHKSSIVQLLKEKESLENDTKTKDEELSLLRITVEKLEHEKKLLKEEIVKQGYHVSLKEATVNKLEKEKQTLIYDVFKKNRELSSFNVNLEKEKNVLEGHIVQTVGELSLSKENIYKLQNEKESLESKLVQLDTELSGVKFTVNELQTEKESLESKLVQLDTELSGVKFTVNELQNEKEALESKLLKLETELSGVKFIVNKLQNERKVFEDDILKREAEISSLESRVFSFEAEKESFRRDICEKDEEISGLVINIRKLEDENNCFTDEVTRNRDEIVSLGNHIHRITEVKKSLESDMQLQEEELSSTRQVLLETQNEKKLLLNNKSELSEELSRFKLKSNTNEENMILLRNDLQKAKTEKNNVENMMKEEEEDFEKLIDVYLREIESWKKKFSILEEEMSVLRSETNRLECEKQDLQIVVQDMSESKSRSEETVQESFKACHKEMDSWKVKVRALESDNEVLRTTLHQLKTESEVRKWEMKQITEDKEKEMEVKLKEFHSTKQIWTVEKGKELEQLRLEMESELREVQSQRSTKEMELNDRTVRIKQLQDEADQFTKVVSEQKEEITKMESRVKELENVKLETETTIQRVREQFDEKENELKHYIVIVEKVEHEKRKLTNTIEEKEERISTVENDLKDSCLLHKEQEESQSMLRQEHENSKKELKRLQAMQSTFEEKDSAAKMKLDVMEKEVKRLQAMQSTFEAKDSAAKMKLDVMEKEVNRLRNEISSIQQRNLVNNNLGTSLRSNIEKSREQLRLLLADIDETSKIKLSLEKEHQVLQSNIDKNAEQKTKLEMEVFCLKEITAELTKGKLTLLEEIARLSDQKKEGQEVLNNEFSRLRNSNGELRKENEKTRKENSELIVLISSLKITLATVQSAYEQTQDELKSRQMRLEAMVRLENQNNQEREKVNSEFQNVKMKITHLEERNLSITNENKELSLSLSETRKRFDTLEKEYETSRRENIILLERIKNKETDNDEQLESGRPSTQVSNLRKKIKEFRTKLSEEKKQGEIHEFEIKNLKEKVERLVKKEKDVELQLETIRKKLLEIKTERDGLLMDLDSVNKRKKKDMEGYTSRIETLEGELRLFEAKESKLENGKQIKETVDVLNEEKKILEHKLASNQERHQREVTELKTTLDALQNRYNTELKIFESTETANRNYILELKKSLASVERKCENQVREVETSRGNFLVVSEEREKLEKTLREKNFEFSKWKKESLNDKVEIKFLRGSLNILEKEGLTDKTRDIVRNK